MPVTDRVSDKNLIELAKQQFESSKQSMVPANAVSLPSQGKVYPESSPLRQGYVEMRHMTAYDEDILSNGTYIRQGIVFDKLLESLLITPVDLNDIISADKEAMIIAARIHGYGAEYPVTVIDPNTNTQLQRTLNLDKLKTRSIELESDENGEFTYTIQNHVIKYRYISSKLLSSISAEHSVSQLLERTITEVDGSRKQMDITDFIRFKMTPLQSKQFRKHLEETVPRLLLQSEFAGEDGGTFTAGFQVGSDLFWFE